ncbi:MAG: (2Fe-2S) ferredoxin domain-containing protein [Cyanobacteria bacterium J06649_5]
MNILQGQYSRALTSGKGKLKGLYLETEQGMQAIQLPKPLRAIAQQELTLGDSVRIWAISADPKKRPKKQQNSKKAVRKGNISWVAVQLIPLSPKQKVSATALTSVKATPVKPKTAVKPKKKAKKKGMTVQVCQKKNCCRRGGDALWESLKASQQMDQQSAQPPAPSTPVTVFKLEAVGCLGGCKRGPNLRILPANVKYRSVKVGQISQILQKHSR